MAENVFRPDRRPAKSPTGGVEFDPPQMPPMAAFDNEVASAQGDNVPRGTQVSGNIPPGFQKALGGFPAPPPMPGFAQHEQPQEHVQPQMMKSSMSQQPRQQQARRQGGKFAEFADAALEAAMRKIAEKAGRYEEVVLPSQGRFYQGMTGLPANGVLQLRPMSGEEETIFTTARIVKSGMATDKLLEACISGNVIVSDLLTIDREYLLIYLRGISFTPEYECEIKCPECGKAFNTTVNLNALPVTDCPADFGPEHLTGETPSGLKFSYRLSTGRDEMAVNTYRTQMSEQFGDASKDDSMLYRTATLITDLEGVTGVVPIKHLLGSMLFGDLQYIQSVVNEDPFGVNTQLHLICSHCAHEFDIDMPKDVHFFFPNLRKKKNKR